MEGKWAPQIGKENKYGYNEKELNEEFGLNLIDYGFRWYDPAIGKFHSVDPHTDTYTSLTPYNYVSNNPLLYIDPDGRDLYLFYSVEDSDNEEDTGAFWSATLTRAKELLNSDDFDSSEDRFVAKRIKNLGGLKEDIESQISEYSEEYGKTKEVGIWSHGGFDGPGGSEPASKGALTEGSSQLSMSTWGSINFNWAEGSSCSFYACRTGMTDKDYPKAFNQRISELSNFANVDVLGQTNYAYPSKQRTARLTDPGIRKGFNSIPTYYVGGDKNSFSGRFFIGYSYPMSVYRNGKMQKSRFQSK